LARCNSDMRLGQIKALCPSLHVASPAQPAPGPTAISDCGMEPEPLRVLRNDREAACGLGARSRVRASSRAPPARLRALRRPKYFFSSRRGRASSPSPTPRKPAPFPDPAPSRMSTINSRLCRAAATWCSPVLEFCCSILQEPAETAHAGVAILEGWKEKMRTLIQRWVACEVTHDKGPALATQTVGPRHRFFLSPHSDKNLERGAPRFSSRGSCPHADLATKSEEALSGPPRHTTRCEALLLAQLTFRQP